MSGVNKQATGGLNIIKHMVCAAYHCTALAACMSAQLTTNGGSGQPGGTPDARSYTPSILDSVDWMHSGISVFSSDEDSVSVSSLVLLSPIIRTSLGALP